MSILLNCAFRPTTRFLKCVSRSLRTVRTPYQTMHYSVLVSKSVCSAHRTLPRFGAICRFQSNRSLKYQKRTTLNYMVGVTVFTLGFGYAAVPLYSMFCQAYSYGGTLRNAGHDDTKVETMERVPGRQIVITFNADKAASMRWNFKPQQPMLQVVPGETALAFYTALNPTDVAIDGISTYNVVPYEAGQYFNKIQCFCFEEQRINPGEQVDLPVFFYIDPEFADDPLMEHINNITLSYTFFETMDSVKMPIPDYAAKHAQKLLVKKD